MGRKAIHQFPTSDAPLWELVGPGKQLSYKWLSARTGYTPKMIWMIATGRRRITKRFRSACAMALQVPESDLFIEDCVGHGAAATYSKETITV